LFSVTFAKEKLSAEFPEGTTILEAAKQLEIFVETPCGGAGTCEKCLVRLGDALEEVLACQTEISSDVTVYTGEYGKTGDMRILSSDGDSFTYSIAPAFRKTYNGGKTEVRYNGELIGEEPGDTTGHIYGLAIDIGTTTLAVGLIDMLTGTELATESALNPQSGYAQDVLSRIKLAAGPEQLGVLHSVLLKELESLLQQLTIKAGIEPAHIYEAVYSGNTTMIYLALGEDPKSLGRFPYNFAIKGNSDYPVQQLTMSPFARIYVPPVISAFVGPDITSGVIASQLASREDTVLFIDVGTNGEMVIADGGELAATSTAAGPAFEGMNISCGMRADRGAIEHFEISGENIIVRTIGNAPAVGICGSGLMDIVGELVKWGVISASGRFIPPDKGNYGQHLADRMVEKDGKYFFEVAEGVLLSQNDVRQVQLAKGAVRAGVEALLADKGVGYHQVGEVLIAGAFGFHLREESLLNIGLLPSELRGKVSFSGNTSKSGAKAFLLCTMLRQEVAETVSRIEVVELSTMDGFDRLFVRSLSF